MQRKIFLKYNFLFFENYIQCFTAQKSVSFPKQFKPIRECLNWEKNITKLGTFFHNNRQALEYISDMEEPNLECYEYRRDFGSEGQLEE